MKIYSKALILALLTSLSTYTNTPEIQNPLSDIKNTAEIREVINTSDITQLVNTIAQKLSKALEASSLPTTHLAKALRVFTTLDNLLEDYCGCSINTVLGILLQQKTSPEKNIIGLINNPLISIIATPYITLSLYNKAVAANKSDSLFKTKPLLRGILELCTHPVTPFLILAGLATYTEKIAREPITPLRVTLWALQRPASMYCSLTLYDMVRALCKRYMPLSPLPSLRVKRPADDTLSPLQRARQIVSTTSRQAFGASCVSFAGGCIIFWTSDYVGKIGLQALKLCNLV